MKRVLLASILALSASVPALADVRYDVDEVASLNYDGTTLSYVYRTGGGCAEHTSDVTVTITPESVTEWSANVKIGVVDITPNGDDCEAYIAVSGTVNLKEKIQAALAAQNLTQVQTIEVELPKLRVDLNQ